jgi:two-component system, NarL family, sensor kinase
MGQIIQTFDEDWIYIKRFEKEIKETSSDSIRAYNSFKLSIMYRLVNDTLKANHYLEQGIKLSKANTFLQGAAYYYTARSFNFSKGKAIESNLMLSDSLLREINNNEAYSIRGGIWHYQSIYLQNSDREGEALDIILNKAIPLAQKSGNNYLLGMLHHSVAVSLMNSDQPKKAQEYLAQAMAFFNKPTDNPRTLYFLVTTYIDAAENYITLGLYDSVKLELDKAKLILESKPTSSMLVSLYYVEGIYYDQIKQYSKALLSFDKGINFPEVNSFYLGQLKYGKYKALSHNNDHKEALLVLQDLIANHVMYNSDRKNYYKGMFLTYKELGNIQAAYNWAEQYITLSDSLYKAEYQNDIAELEVKFNNAENQKKISILQAEKEKVLLKSENNQLLVWLLGGATVFLLVISFFAWQLYRNSRKLTLQKEQNYQQQLKEAEQVRQVQFAKALLEGEEKERKRLAGDLHDGLGGMLAGVKINLSRIADTNQKTNMTNDLDRVILQLDNSVDELRRIARNLMPESLSSLGLEAALNDMCGSLSNEITHVDFQAFTIDSNMAKEVQATIFRIVQELLTNAVRHAKASEILVQCSQNGNTFFITVEDNGIGFDVNTNKGSQKGIGLANLKRRIDYLQGKMEISSVPGNGTSINIELNVTI